MEQFTFFESYYKAGRRLPDDERLALYDTLLAYMFDNEDNDPEGVAGAVWEAIKPVAKKSKAKANSGKLGGTQKANRKQTVSKPKANSKQTEANRKQTVSHKEKDKGEGEGKEKDKGVINTPPNPPTGEKPLTASALIEERGYGSVLEAAVKDWVQYKTEKRQTYKPTGLKSLLTEIQHNANEYGDKAIVDVINKSMTANYTGIVWDWLKKPTARSGTTDGLEEFIFAGGRS